MPAIYLKLWNERYDLLKGVVAKHRHESPRHEKLYQAVRFAWQTREGPHTVITESQMQMLHGTANTMESIAYDMQHNKIDPITALLQAAEHTRYAIRVIQGSGQKSYLSALYKVRRVLRTIEEEMQTYVRPIDEP